MIYRVKEVCSTLKISRATLYRMIKKGKFPRPAVRLGERICAWTEKQILDFIEEQTKKANSSRR